MRAQGYTWRPAYRPVTPFVKWLGVIWLLLLLATAAFSQALDAQHIVRTNDVNQRVRRDAISWFQGDTVIYDLFPQSGGIAISTPTNALAVWFVYDSALTNRLLAETGTVSSSSGPVRFTLSYTSAALEVGTYESFVYISTGVVRRQIDHVQVEIRAGVLP
jgi:hypothetical protein